MAEKEKVIEHHGEIAAPFIVSDALVKYGINSVLDDEYPIDTELLAT